MGNKIFLIMVLIWPPISWSKNTSEVPLIKHTTAKNIVDDVYHEILSTWSVDIDNENSNVFYLNSPARKINKSTNYCFQNSIEIHEDEFKRKIPVAGLFFDSDFHEKYSLNPNGLPCEEVLESSMFRVFSLSKNGANIGLLNMLKEISEKPWQNKVNKKYQMTFQSDEARLCLTKGNEALNFLSIREVSNDSDYLEYELNTQDCVIDNEKWIVKVSIHEFIDGKKYKLYGRAIRHDIAECIRKECYRN